MAAALEAWRERLAKCARAVGIVSAWFLILYAIFRGAVEFVREPDAHIGYIGWNWLTMGQLLSIPMLLAGIAILILTLRRAAAD